MRPRWFCDPVQNVAFQTEGDEDARTLEISRLTLVGFQPAGPGQLVGRVGRHPFYAGGLEDPILFRPVSVAPCPEQLAEAELLSHEGYNGSSFAAAGASFVSPSGAVVDVGPAMRFDFLGGRTEELFGDRNVGGVVRLRWTR